MSTWQAVNALIDVLASGPDAAVSPGHASWAVPGVLDDLPAIVVTAQDVVEHAGGVDGLIANAPESGRQSTVTRSTGQLVLELWAPDRPAMTVLADGAFGALEPSNPALAAAGFQRVGVRSIGAMTREPLGDDAATLVLRMPVGCSFAHETVPVEDTTKGVIATVSVEMHDSFSEVTELGAPLDSTIRDALNLPTP